MLKIVLIVMIALFVLFIWIKLFMVVIRTLRTLVNKIYAMFGIEYPQNNVLDSKKQSKDASKDASQIRHTKTPRPLYVGMLVLEKQYAKLLPNDSQAKLKQLVKYVQEVEPVLETKPSFFDEKIEISHLVEDVLPNILRHYIQLPKDYTTRHVNEEGKTPADLLHEQLVLVVSYLENLQSGLFAENVKELEMNQTFLKQKLSVKLPSTPDVHLR